MNTLKYLIPLIASAVLVGCGGSTAATPETSKVVIETPKAKVPVVIETPDSPAAATLFLSFTATKAFSFTWAAVPSATSYKLKEAATDGAGYTLVKETTATSFDHIVPLYARINAKYILESCNAGGCTDSAEVFTSTRVAEMVDSIGYFKASNAGLADEYGISMSLSADGNTLAVGAELEDGGSQMMNENVSAVLASNQGAVYVFTRNGAQWIQQAYLKAENAETNNFFGGSVSLSADGDKLAVGARGLGSEPKGAGAVYVFTRTGEVWSEHAFLVASNPGIDDYFGYSVSISGNGNTLAVSAPGEDGSAAGASGGGTDTTNAAPNSGAVYVFTVNNTAWAQQAYLKASNTDENDRFGHLVSLSGNGDTLAVGAENEGGNNNALLASGAVYVFSRSGVGANAVWAAPVYLKSSNPSIDDKFGGSVSLSADGNTLAVGAINEDSNLTGVNPEGGGTASNSGAAYVFSLTSEGWGEPAYLKASNTGIDDQFGSSVSISADGNTLAVSARVEGSDATGIAGNEGDGDGGSQGSGAVYTLTRSAGIWSQQAYVKASNPDRNDRFGISVVLSSDGDTLAVSSKNESSNATGVNADQENNDATDAGAVYVY